MLCCAVGALLTRVMISCSLDSPFWCCPGLWGQACRSWEGWRGGRSPVWTAWGRWPPCPSPRRLGSSPPTWTRPPHWRAWWPGLWTSPPWANRDKGKNLKSAAFWGRKLIQAGASTKIGRYQRAGGICFCFFDDSITLVRTISAMQCHLRNSGYTIFW